MTITIWFHFWFPLSMETVNDGRSVVKWQDSLDLARKSQSAYEILTNTITFYITLQL